MGLSPSAATGSVFLVQSEPGRPGALSRPALAALAAADAVLHDNTVDPGILALVPGRVLVEPMPNDAARVGKLPGEGWRVVWLAGGDPAHLPEHRVVAERLRQAGIATQTIAGFLHGDDENGVAAAIAPVGVAAPQLLATALNGLAG